MEHILSGLSLPDRYETLTSKLGAEVAQILVPPAQESADALERASLAVTTRNEGLFVPLSGRPGAGKTTFSNSLFHFFPTAYRQTVPHDGAITFDALRAVAEAALQDRKPNDSRILPILLDHRERNPPTDEELAAIKRFLRNAQLGVQPILLWPETNAEHARQMSNHFVEVAGPSPIPLPLNFLGPEKSSWQDIAINTLRVTNGVDSLEDLGVDPRDYQPDDFHTIGDFLRKISTDFDDRRFKLLKETQRPITLVIVYCSQSQEPGVITQLTSSSRYGLADSHALVGVTPTSELGKWWNHRRGLLTRAVIQLNIHLLAMPPGASVGVLRRHGTDAVKKLLDEAGIRNPGPVRLARDLARSDVGKFLRGEQIRAYEARGTPAKVSVDAFNKVANAGFVYGRDKPLNKAFSEAWKDFHAENSLSFNKIAAEEHLGFVSLIPDTAIHTSDGVVCVEYHWRKGDFLRPSNRSDVAGYALKKIRDYVRQLGWTND